MPMTFYDCSGKPVAYTEDDVHIFLYSGIPVGYLYNSSVYAYTGRHLGTLRSGWIRDQAGHGVLFTDEAASGVPPLPPKLVKPRKLLKKPKPPKGSREAPPPRAEDVEEWSQQAGEGFFGS
ncbi:MAG TPA: hypothetical protein VKM72_35995 [Thermoanaerobaculia bacterium]|nr:hypothetical protein [Thermoanaerobaculia bacterium]